MNRHKYMCENKINLLSRKKLIIRLVESKIKALEVIFATYEIGEYSIKEKDFIKFRIRMKFKIKKELEMYRGLLHFLKSMDKQELIIEAIRNKLFTLDSEIAQDKMILIKNPDASDTFKNLKRKSIQSNRNLQSEYRKLLKEIEEDESLDIK